jgi:competence protein ComEA
VRPTSRSSDDADVIRARLRLLLDERHRPGGWLPDDDVDGDVDGLDGDVGVRENGLSSTPAPWSTGPSGPLPPLSDAQPNGLPQGLGRHRMPGTAVRLDPGRRGVWSLWMAGAVAAVLVVTWTWWQRPQVQPVPASASAPSTSGALSAGRSGGAARAGSPASTSALGRAASTAVALVVSVVGGVRHPGLVTLAPGARVADALAAAGGLLPGADAASVNLAAVVTDGQQIAVGVPGATGDTGAQPSSSSGAGGGAPVNLNAATAADLDGLPGIGPVLAQRIVDYRLQQGPFTSVDQLDDVPGIGPALFAQLRKRVIV